MPTRVTQAVLACLLLPQLAVAVQLFTNSSAVLCACTPSACSCSHQHAEPKPPHCHLPNGRADARESAPGRPTLQRCHTHAVAPAGVFVLPRARLPHRLLVEQRLALADLAQESFFSPRPLTPPPRSSR